ncbi:succinate dehydrogenase/fumarate reductase flavoprotein subunit [Desulfitobacterium dichloroeliminans LMG P-21439]|uniref:Succinate dehydrogenase/fumarate reductase flavoprotein subunit n=1 Tax=Desulfitobacterium dichloroeliminans (strain LMG P-21439 / DCA1) TaxID=871963 RepID=L0F580_DESDL|nr:FAD-binding protein [Desulfitobacterium dichloroeliminans]AGA68989.1 succinate dehydrogenase/fumarate reductase flavoprotein subunit [Desulfitobacterium dichloroeliminans LMG P-21439]
MEVEKITCDVLCVGGGIAGLMAAIEAADNGAKVVVAEKAYTERSGAGGMGNDHFHCYIPEVHGDYSEFAKDLYYGQMAGKISEIGKEAADFWFQNTFDIIKLWDKWGIPMKYEGRYEFAGHSFKGQILNHLKYSGENQKPVLTKQARERGVTIINRVMIYDLIKDENGVVGALGISTREDKLYEFDAKAVILATGLGTRMYPSATLHDFNRPFPATNTCDGRAMAYRAGADLMNIELTSRHAGPKYYNRAGQATWIGVLRNRQGKPVGPFMTEPDRYYSDMTTEVNKSIFADYIKQGKGPIYMDGRGMSNDDLAYVNHWLLQEGNGGLLNHLEEEGIDLRKHPVEFMTFDMCCWSGIPYNKNGETSVEGLYAAGDESMGGISCAAVFGRSAGKNASVYAGRRTASKSNALEKSTSMAKTEIEELRKRKEGPKWQETSQALQQIMRDYAESVRCEDGLQAGLVNLYRLKTKAHERLVAENSHELMHCLEVFNLIDIGQLIFTGALDRKETRGANHIRPDYPITNPILTGKAHLARKNYDGSPMFVWK